MLEEGKDNLTECKRGEDQRTKGGEPECWQEVTTSWSVLAAKAQTQEREG